MTFISASLFWSHHSEMCAFFYLADQPLVRLDSVFFMPTSHMTVSCCMSMCHCCKEVVSLYVHILSNYPLSLTLNRYGWLAHILYKKGVRTFQGDLAVPYLKLLHMLIKMSIQLELQWDDQILVWMETATQWPPFRSWTMTILYVNIWF